MTPSRLLVFTDLDGTLLDADTYSYEPAISALKRLKAYNIPVIVCTSKTRAETEWHRQQLNLTDPFIVENGGAVYVPINTFPLAPHGGNQCEKYWVMEMGVLYNELRNALREISVKSGVTLKGFGDMTVEEVSNCTGLTLCQAIRSKQREYDEPFWVPETASLQQHQLIHEMASTFGLMVLQGGRFSHLVGGTDKGKACRTLIEAYRRFDNCVEAAAFGNSQNDLPMLQAVDHPFLVEKPAGGYGLELSADKRIVKLSGAGPVGWAHGVDILLKNAQYRVS